MTLIACHGPNPDYLGVQDIDSSSATTTDTSTSTSTNTTTSDDSETGTTGPDTPQTDTTDSTDTTDTSDTTDTTGDADPTCGDGNADPGEFCFEYSELLMTLGVQALASADFDDDGDMDLVIAGKDDVLVLLGDGGGGFPLQVDLPEMSGNYRGAAGATSTVISSPT